jgi:hypothetical protein
MTNPLDIYRKESGEAWTELGVKTGLSHQTLLNISRMGKKELQSVRLGTAVVLKKELGVDLADYIINE